MAEIQSLFLCKKAANSSQPNRSTYHASTERKFERVLHSFHAVNPAPRNLGVAIFVIRHATRESANANGLWNARSGATVEKQTKTSTNIAILRFRNLTLDVEAIAPRNSQHANTIAVCFAMKVPVPSLAQWNVKSKPSASPTKHPKSSG